MARNPKNTRMCAACRTHRQKNEMLCVNRSKDWGFDLLMPGQIAEGRGVYICPDVGCISGAIKKKSFSRSFRCEVPSDIYSRLEAAALNISETTQADN